MPSKNYYYCEECRDYSTNPEKCEHHREFIFSEKMRRNLSKFLSYIFRHDPDQIGIALDKNGYSLIPIATLIEILKKERHFSWITRRILEALIFLDQKGRFEIKNNRFRARYGHSLKNVTITVTNDDLPEVLYHGTNKISYKQIRSEGLKPMGRNLVHLTNSIKEAKIVGSRHKGELILLKIDVKSAVNDGLQVWQAGNTVFVSGFIPPKYIKLI